MAKTFEEIQAEVMELARKNDMDEADAMRLLRARVRAAGLKMPKGTATDAQAMKQQAEMAKGKAAMQKGGMANGKVHMYSGGGSVTDKMNPGLKALAKKRPDVVANILK